jgi:dihydroflavonol-4-reductase
MLKHGKHEGTRVFITGATGFVGGALARVLAWQGAEVHALARANADRSALNDVPITWHEGDVTRPDSLNGELAKATRIIHAAGRLGEAGVPETTYRQINVEGTRNVLEAALKAGSKTRVLHVSSAGVLGRTSREPATEERPYAPNNPYERSKVAAERVALDYAAKGLPVVVARPGLIYGPGDHHVLKLFRAIRDERFFYIAGGQRLCHPTYIDDVVAGLLACLDNGRLGETYHFTGPRPVTFRELAETIALTLGVRRPWLNLPGWPVLAGASCLEAVGRIAKWRPPLSRNGVDFFRADRVFSWRKAQAELDYTPAHDLATGIGLTVTWYQRNGLL